MVPDMSAAEAVLKMCGQLPCFNEKLLRLSKEHGDFCRIIATHPESRAAEEVAQLRSLIRYALDSVIRIVDACCTTSAAALSDLASKYTRTSNTCVIEEAGNAVEGETVNAWRGDHKEVAMVGDPKQ